MPGDSLVSVLVPAYNHERWVSECLASVAAQTHPDLELLVANDGSTDGTHDAIEAFLAMNAGRFTRVVYLNRPNRGLATTLNELLSHARGRFLFLIASDDRAKPQAVETLHAVLARRPRYALAVGDNEIIDAGGRRVYWDAERRNVDEPGPDGFRTWGEFLKSARPARDFRPRRYGHVEALERNNYIPNGKLYRRSAVLKVGGWRPGTLEDWDLNFRLARRYRFTYVDTVLFSYRWHDTNTIKDSRRIDKLGERTRDLIDSQCRNPQLWLRIRLHREPLRWLGRRLGAAAREGLARWSPGRTAGETGGRALPPW